MSEESDPLERAAARPLATRGEGCLRRYDPDELGEQHGTEFSDAAELWRRLNSDQSEPEADAQD